MTERPKPPPGLRTRGRRYWVTTTDAYELTDSELEVLTEICRTLDDLDALAAAVKAAGPMVLGSAGQPVVNPALTEARGQRAILHRLVSALRLPDAEGETIPTGHQLRAVAANAARWSGRDKGA